MAKRQYIEKAKARNKKRLGLTPIDSEMPESVQEECDRRFWKQNPIHVPELASFSPRSGMNNAALKFQGKPHETILEIVRRYGFEFDWDNFIWWLPNSSLDRERRAQDRMFGKDILTGNEHAGNCILEIREFVSDCHTMPIAEAVKMHRGRVILRGKAEAELRGCDTYVDPWGGHHDTLCADAAPEYSLIDAKVSVEAYQGLYDNSPQESPNITIGRLIHENMDLKNKLDYAEAKYTHVAEQLSVSMKRLAAVEAELREKNSHIEVLKLEARGPSAAASAKPARRGPVIHCQGEEDGGY